MTDRSIVGKYFTKINKRKNETNIPERASWIKYFILKYNRVRACAEVIETDFNITLSAFNDLLLNHS